MSDYVPTSARALALYHAAISPEGWQHLDEIASHANAYPELINWISDVQQLCSDENMSVDQAVSMIGLPAEPPRAQRHAFIPLLRSRVLHAGSVLMQHRIIIVSAVLTVSLALGGALAYTRIHAALENDAAAAASRTQVEQQAQREAAVEKDMRTALASFQKAQFIEENLKRAYEARVHSLTYAPYFTPATRAQQFESLATSIRSVYAKELNAHLDELTARLSQQLADAQSLSGAPESSEKTQMLTLAAEWAEKKVSEKNATDAQKTIARLEEVTSTVRAQKDVADAAAAQKVQQDADAAAQAQTQTQQQTHVQSPRSTPRGQTQQRSTNRSTTSTPRQQAAPQQNTQQARPNWSVPAQTPEASLPDSIH